MKASADIKDFIKRWEGLRLQAYLCPSGIWTIGYGHTKDVKRGQTIRPCDAEDFFNEDLKEFETAINRMADNARLTLTQGQFDALVSFAYNVGIANLKNSTLWRKAQRDISDPTIANEFGRWVYGTQNGKKVVLQGLVNRRKGEADFWKE